MAETAFERLRVVAPKRARPGDIGCIETPRGTALAIYAGNNRWAWKGNEMLTVTALYPVLKAWRV